MTYLLLFGLAFIILHTISILFVTKISLAKRLFLAAWMMLFVVDIPLFYQYFPGWIFGTICAFALGIYVAVLFSSELFGKKKKKKFSSLQGQTIVVKQASRKNKSDKAKAPQEEPTRLPETKKKPVAPIPRMTELEPVLAKEEPAESKPTLQEALEEVALHSESRTVALKEDKKSETQEIDHLVQDTLQQIDALFSKESLAVKDSSASEGASSISTAPLAVEQAEPSTTSYEEELAKVSLEDMFFASKPEEEVLAEKDAPVADESTLLKEIEEILDTHAEEKAEELEPEAVSETAEVASDPDEEAETGQEDRGFYFQFLMYESQELVAMGNYQEAVDYLKEILIDSEDKNLRRQALELLETIYTTLYQPKLKESAL